MPAPMPTMKPLAGEVRFAGVEPGRDSATILAELHDGSSGPEQPRDMSGPEGLDQGSDSRERTNHATALSGAWTRPGLPLAGLRVVELGTVIAAPFAASLLADLGAEVIKIERPEGDPLRNMGLRDRGLPLWWATASRSKRLCTLDLKDPADHAHFLSLIDRADVLIENNRPGVMQRLGLDWERLHARNPRLVMLSISGFGQTGPYASRPGFGKIAEAMSGIVELTGVPDAMPLHVGFSLADAATGLAGVLGIAQVLHERDVRGTRLGRQIDLALYEPLLRINECQAAIARMSGSAPSRQGSNDPWSFGRSGPADRRIASLRCADGQWVAALLDRPLETSLESLQHQLGRLERTEALRTLKTLSIEAVPVQDGFSLARERYFGRRGDTGLAVDARGIERPAPGVSPHGLGATARWSLSAAPLDPAERRTHWRD
jgi:crotonobetainyl-CoA:carnitine CoA-transferase CaiB-like acyl-CoA transferase